MILPPTLTTTRDGFASIEIGWSGPGIFICLSAMISILLSWKWYLSIQKPRHVSDEQRRILVLRPVIGIGIEDELRVGQVALKNERIRGIDDHVMAAVDHQCRLGNLPEVVKRAPARNTPLADSCDLRRRDLFAHLRVAALLAQAEPLQECPP